MAPTRKGRRDPERGPGPAFLRGPPADETCTLTRVVERAGLHLGVWTCTEPRPVVRVKWSAYRFPQEFTRKWWPGATSAWYDAHYYPDERCPGLDACIPGRTQYVVYEGGPIRTRRERAHTRSSSTGP
jgi:hypothetical protein